MLFSCKQQRNVVPFEMDAEEIYKAMTPNEATPDGVSFGKDSIPAFVYDLEMTSDHPDVYIYFDNLTVMEVNPKITQNILEFIHNELSEYGFVSDTVVLAPDEYEQLLAKGLSYSEAAGKILDAIDSQFENQLKVILTYSTPFNARFDIYPLWMNGDILTYRLTAYCYTGGAHGITISYIRSYSLETGEVLKFENIVNPASRKEVREEIVARMAYAYPIYENITTVEQYLDSLNSWLDNSDTPDGENELTIDNYPVPDVALIEGGLVSVYQMYELSPGSDGCPVVVIPYKDLKGCLNPKIEQIVE